MSSKSPPPQRSRGRLRLILRHPLAFLLRVWRGMRRNQAFLMAGALAYNALLSIVPFFALMLLTLSFFMDEEGLLTTLTSTVEIVVPGQSAVIIEQLRGLLAGRENLGWVAIAMLLFFSTSAFLVLERALERIFQHRSGLVRRHFLVSAVIPYLYMLVIGAGLGILTIGTSMIAALEPHLPQSIVVLLPHDGQPAPVLAVGLLLLEVILFSSIYWVMPAGRISPAAALVGGTAAALLWEIVRRSLAWYFASISIVNVVYGSLTAVIIALLLLEIGGVILLAGAQVIAEYERFVHRERFVRRRRRRTGRPASPVE